jgi:hypothetical protein
VLNPAGSSRRKARPKKPIQTRAAHQGFGEDYVDCFDPGTEARRTRVAGPTMVSSGRCARLARSVGGGCHDGHAFFGWTCLACPDCTDRVRGAQPLASRCVDESPLPIHNLAMGQGGWRASAHRLFVEAHGRAMNRPLRRLQRLPCGAFQCVH